MKNPRITITAPATSLLYAERVPASWCEMRVDDAAETRGAKNQYMNPL